MGGLLGVLPSTWISASLSSSPVHSDQGGSAADARGPRGPSCIQVLETCRLVWEHRCVFAIQVLLTHSCHVRVGGVTQKKEPRPSAPARGAVGAENSLPRRLEGERSKSRSGAERRSLSFPPPLSRTCVSHLALRVSVLSASSSVCLCSLGGTLARRDLLRVLL